MEEARQAVEAFMSRNGKHDTTVHERVAPAVTHETITRTEHEVRRETGSEPCYPALANRRSRT